VFREIAVVAWKIVYTTQARKDAKKLQAAGLRAKAEVLLGVLQSNPYRNPPPYEKLLGDLAGAYSRRINIQHRLVYQIIPEIRTVKVIRMWTHYE
jgi:toxin YoeB